MAAAVGCEYATLTLGSFLTLESVPILIVKGVRINMFKTVFLYFWKIKIKILSLVI